jgi:hypothetical protein
MECQPAYPHQEVDVALTAPLLWGGSQCFKRDLLTRISQIGMRIANDVYT